MYCMYLNVVTLMKSTGEKIPKAILWGDGRVYSIDSYKEIGTKKSKSGKNGILYQVKIGNQQRDLYYDSLHNKWFMDLK